MYWCGEGTDWQMYAVVMSYIKIFYLVRGALHRCNAAEVVQRVHAPVQSFSVVVQRAHAPVQSCSVVVQRTHAPMQSCSEVVRRTHAPVQSCSVVVQRTHAPVQRLSEVVRRSHAPVHGLFVVRRKWDAENADSADARRLFIRKKINLRHSALSASSACGNNV